eukprot:933267-Rhodomonas_salina.7
MMGAARWMKSLLRTTRACANQKAAQNRMLDPTRAYIQLGKTCGEEKKRARAADVSCCAASSAHPTQSSFQNRSRPHANLSTETERREQTTSGRTLKKTFSASGPPEPSIWRTHSMCEVCVLRNAASADCSACNDATPWPDISGMLATAARGRRVCQTDVATTPSKAWPAQSIIC